MGCNYHSLYPGQTNPQHYGTLVSYRLGGNDPLDGVSIYDGGEFLHFVTYGFSELYAKESEDTDISGYGFELTMKLRKLPTVDETEIKNVVGILQSLTRYVFQSGNVIRPYEYIYTQQKSGFDAQQASKLTGFATLPDQAGAMDTPNGKVEFVCVVGLTDKELKSIYEEERTLSEGVKLLDSDVTDYARDDLW